MARAIQVLIWCTLILSVFGQRYVDRPRHPSLDGLSRSQAEETITNLVNLNNLLQSAAQLAYPITTGINAAVGNLLGPNKHLPKYHYHNSYGRYPAHSRLRANKNRKGVGRKNQHAALQDQRMVSLQDGNKRESYKTRYYDYDYEYDYDYNTPYLEPYDSSEVDDDHLFRKSVGQSKSKSKNSGANGPVLVSGTKNNVPNDKYMSESIHAAYPIKINDADLEPKGPVTKSSFGLAKHNLALPISAGVVQNHISPTLPNLANQGNYIKAITNGKDASHIINHEELMLPVSTPNLQNGPTDINPSLANNDNTSGNIYPASNGALPHIIYVLVKPDMIDPGTNPINLLSNQGLKPNTDGALNTDNGYYNNAPRNAGLDVPNVNSPISH